ncbi:bifunctional non-homologous end joining protein LigD [Actinomadura pelletieri DSM 43383]|uniref:Bifunctional non-homologous end joining protein LigD n=1 Tax=Actinomadura pelletieri DSM 43383 TaxID=1120940 RepID=A0A495QI46_9ACTN|nr:non-homologous end-joining DNA ligase [Actinomadura pelletieri]RKS71835.1 bifunctional non-homologous end joining protein LigD [Actinomadura pelletieri DSM 43383]
MTSKRTTVEVEGRQVSLSNLDKNLYPEFTKGEVIDYYARIAPVMLPHLKDRAATRIRWPDGVDGAKFFEKNAPSHTPDWVRTATIPTPGSSTGRDTLDFVVVDDLPTLVWCANLAALELHVPQWKVGPRGGVRNPDLVVFDLDPGEPATIVEACEVAHLLRDLLAEDGLESYPKTSGKKGLHLYVPIKEPTNAERTSEYAKTAARRLAEEHPRLVVAKMEKRLRKGRIFVDWSQNNPAKTTVAPYSLRAARRPSVSTPVTWDELESCADAADLVFTPAEILDRVDEHGDLLEPLLKDHRPLP